LETNVDDVVIQPFVPMKRLDRKYTYDETRFNCLGGWGESLALEKLDASSTALCKERAIAPPIYRKKLLESINFIFINFTFLLTLFLLTLLFY
jgi:hypothetical protein